MRNWMECLIMTYGRDFKPMAKIFFWIYTWFFNFRLCPRAGPMWLLPHHLLFPVPLCCTFRTSSVPSSFALLSSNSSWKTTLLFSSQILLFPVTFLLTISLVFLIGMHRNKDTTYIPTSAWLQRFVLHSWSPYGWFHLATAKICWYWWKLQYCNRIHFLSWNKNFN